MNNMTNPDKESRETISAFRWFILAILSMLIVGKYI